ncbi:MMPL family transporter [Nocardioides sp. zg-579]|uniref:MMPL family transporter n=1 Tax=Nocardioides marmotae TaxID=2663857 RepID=A0A6I3IWZ9_9ACTN|nr:MMPL family transporter [Nocardioides marmotae]MCR6031265.1 MMPL family transporter [Gordonia jinghuaiqii]MTB94903.1 MMPL family transporter [Nocardioides marmotae]QKE02583.1 MMPL family transporter [Nocardioides marmotae]
MRQHIAGSLTGRVTSWLVLLAWIAAFVVSAGLSAKLTDVQDNEAASWLPESAESTRVSEELAGTVDPNDIPTLVVYQRDGGLTDADLGAIEQQAAAMADVDGVSGKVVDARTAEAAGFDSLSPDGEVAVTTLTLNFGDDGWNAIPDAAEELRSIAALDGGTVHLAGYGGQAADSAEAFEGIDTNLVVVTFAVVIVILLLTYRSPTLWLLPILSAAVAYTVSGGVVYLLAAHAGLTVNAQSQAILGILVIGAGTDYALLLVARYREELRRHDDRHAAMAVALHRAAPAILASAATVVVSMLCLGVAELNSTAGLGPVLAIGVSVTFLVMVTLLPALLVITGRWVFWPRRPLAGSREPTATGLWARVGRAIEPRPRRVWVLTAAALAVACLGVLRLDTSGLSTEDTYTEELDSVRGQRVLVEHGLLDSSNTAQVVADTDQIDEVLAAMADVEGLGRPSEPRPVSDERAYVEATVDHDISSGAAFDVVTSTRTAVHDVGGADALVGGGSAVYLDTQVASDRDSRVIMPLVLVVVLLILIGLLRAVAAPLLLIATVVLSFGAALGISTLLFDYVFGFAGADPGFPLFAFVFLVALGIDYNIFLMTRVREESVLHGTRQGALIGLRSTGGVITSAGLVLAATFLMLATIPFVFLVELGVAVALGVLLDTMVVRSVLVTALNLDLGDRIWWPSALARRDRDRDTPAPVREDPRVGV